MELSPVEARIMGSLAEKQLTTPQQYPLTINALVAACNQTSTATQWWPTTTIPSSQPWSRLGRLACFGLCTRPTVARPSGIAKCWTNVLALMLGVSPSFRFFC